MSHTVSQQFSKVTRKYKSVLSGALFVTLMCTVSTPILANVVCQNTAIASGDDCVYNPADVRLPTEDAAQIAAKKTTVNGGSTTTMTGTMTFQAGENGFGGNSSLDNIGTGGGIIEIEPQAGYTPDMATVMDLPVIRLDLKDKVIPYTDQITGDVFDFSIYDNDEMIMGKLETQTIESFYAVGQDQYLEMRLGEVEATGGVLTVETEFQNTGGGIGGMHIAAKNSTLFLAQGDGTATSRIIWNVATPTTLNMSAAATGEDAEASTTQYVNDWPVSIDVTLIGGTVETHIISDEQSFKDFNDALAAHITAGTLPPSNSMYDDYITAARNLKSITIKYEQPVSNNPQPDDKIFVGNGTKAILRASGEGASVEMAAGTQLNGRGLGGVLYADNGAVAINDGTVNVIDGSALNITAGAGVPPVRSSGTNSGVINAQYRATGVYITGSDFTNETNGIINVEVSDDEFQSYGLRAYNGSIVTNDGIINLGTNAGGIQNGSSHGAIVSGSEFHNTGTIYVGRATQTTPGQVVPDTNVQAANLFTAIQVIGDSTVTNTGGITIGTLSDGIDVFHIVDNDTATVSHSGNVLILGNTTRGKMNTGFFISNAGARTENAGVVTNNITMEEGSVINLQGTNATAMYILAEGAGTFSSASMLGDIIVEGDRHPVTGMRNHGIWAITEGGGQNIVDVTGNITLRGIGAIGVHARGNSTVNVVDGGNVIFDTGSDQVGYFMVGPEASVRVLRNDLAVSTDRSALFRIEAGALFDGRDYHVRVSGDEAIGVMGVSNDTVIDIENGLYDVTGNGAMAVKITGGSKGWLYNDAKMNLIGDGSRGIVADGNEFNFLNVQVGWNNTNTEANSTTNINATGANVIGFTAMNYATLNYTSSDRMFPSPINSATRSNTPLQTNFYGANSVAFKGLNTSNFKIENIHSYVNGWVFNTNNGTHTINMADVKAVGTTGFLQNQTDLGQPASIANLKMKNVQFEGIVTTDVNSTTNIDMDTPSTWYMAGGSNLTQLDNLGVIAFSKPASAWSGAFKNIEVSGDYTGGPNSQIHMHVALDDGVDPTTTDRLILGNSYGFSTLFIQNGGGYGKKTVDDGIEIITVLGTSDAVFELGRRLFAGAYEYELFKGDINGVNGNWYLRSTGFRPEVPMYSAANNFIARMGQNTLGTYRERHGYADSVKLKPREWARVYGSYNNAKQKRVDPIVDTSNFFKHGTSYSTRMGGVQAGMDLLRRGGEGSAHDSAGVYVAVGQGVGDVNHVINEKAGKIHQNAYNVGGYWTRTGERENWYVDAVAQVSYYNIDGTTAQGLTGGTHGLGYAGSIELGYDLPLTTSKSWSIEPQAQVIYQRTNVRDITDYAGHIRFDSVNNIYTRLGARLVTTQKWGEMQQPLKAWLRADIWRDVSPKTYTKFSALDDTPSVQIKNKPVGTWGTVGLGVAGHLNNTVSIFASSDYSHNISHEDDRGWNGRVGLNIQW